MPGIAAGPPILLTGATGYVGGRLLHALLERGERIRCLARRPEALPSAPSKAPRTSQTIPKTTVPQ
ncbi:MAG: NAD-dependent epimerase/dehydratase family protein, partial [Dehalococcoidia bacterium]